MVRLGLLLVPERIEWRERLASGAPSQPIVSYQKRICFTELSPQELSGHADAFGPFSLEFEVMRLRQLGALPVFYVPRAEADIGYDALGTAILARMTDIQLALTRLAAIADVVATADANEQLRLTRNGADAGPTRATAGGAKDLLRVIFEGIQPPQALLNTVRAMSGLFYPTEDPLFTGLLGYYRQREWRILGNMVLRGAEATRRPTENELGELLQIDEAFFGRRIAFPTGEFSRAQQCLFLREVADHHVLTYARRLFCPATAVEDATRILADVAPAVRVEATG